MREQPVPHRLELHLVLDGGCLLRTEFSRRWFPDIGVGADEGNKLLHPEWLKLHYVGNC